MPLKRLAGLGLAAAVLLIPGVGLALDYGNLTLTDCREIALENNDSLQAAEKAVKRSEAVLTQARSAYFPKFTASSRWVKMEDPINLKNFTLNAIPPDSFNQMVGAPPGTAIPFEIELFEITDDEMVITDVTAEMPLFTWFKITNYNKMAKRGIEIEKAKLEKVQDRLLRDVVSAYKTAVLAREARRTLLEVIEEMELFYKTAQEDFENGASNAPEKDVLQIQYDLDDMKTWLPELDKWEKLSIEGLKVAMGLDPATYIGIVGDTLEYPTAELEVGQLIDQAMANRPELRILDNAVEATDLKRKVAAVTNLPMVGAFAQQQWVHDDFDANQESNWTVGVGATMEVFDGLKGYGEYQEAKYEKQRLARQRALAKKGITFEVKEKHTEVEEFYAQLKLREEAREKAVKQVQVVRQGYQYGITTADDVNDAQVQKRWADAHVLFKKLEYVLAIAKLNEVVGVEVFPLN